jgi:hypothetical protein
LTATVTWLCVKTLQLYVRYKEWLQHDDDDVISHKVEHFDVIALLSRTSSCCFCCPGFPRGRPEFREETFALASDACSGAVLILREVSSVAHAAIGLQINI